jgi:hypothetical protein
MKKKTNHAKPVFSSIISIIQRNVANLFESGDKRNFQRLKDFISA